MILYDIGNDAVRARLAKELLYYGIRTQKSVFEAVVSDGEIKELQRIVDHFASLDSKNSVNLYMLTPDAYRKTKRLGVIEELTIDDFII